jgi:ribosome maturation factor RimP
VREEVEGRRTWEGTLAGFADGVISLEVAPGEIRRLALDQVKKANLKFEW